MKEWMVLHLQQSIQSPLQVLMFALFLAVTKALSNINQVFKLLYPNITLTSTIQF